MPRAADGQFEVLLGNKQLLSILFIVVILLGVFFTMGYVLGRNSARQEVASAPVGAQRTAPPESGGVSPFAGEDTPPAAGRPASSPALTQATAPAATASPQAKPPATPSAQPAPGETYLQVAAVKRPEAELVAEVLNKKGFRSLIAPHPTEAVYRVLVGPLKDVDEIARIRADLEAAGFKPILRKF